VTELASALQPLGCGLVALSGIMVFGIVQDHLDGVFTVASPYPGASIMLRDHHGDAVQFTHVIMECPHRFSRSAV